MAETDSTAERWAKFVKDGLARRGMNNSQLADQVGVHRATVGIWVRGEVSAPDHEKVRAVAKALGVDVKDAYLAAGILRGEDLDVHMVEKELGQVSSEDLVAEIDRRMARLTRYEKRGLALPPEQGVEVAPSMRKARALRSVEVGTEGESRQSGHDLAAAERRGRKGADSRGLDDDHE